MSRSTDQTQELSILSGGHLTVPSGGPSSELLQVFPNRTPERLYVITLEFPEFTSLCPVTGQPDFGRIRVEYIPDTHCVETKSFKLYMFAFRDHHSFMETLTNQIVTDLCAVMQPRWCRVQGLFAPRGGIRLNVYAEEYKKYADGEQEEEEKVRAYVQDYRRDVRLETQHDRCEI